jgi:hypothetical protein
MPTYSIYLTTKRTYYGNNNINYNILATDYFPLLTNNTNINGSTILTDTNVVSYSSLGGKLCANFTANSYLISSNTTLTFPISFCYWFYAPSSNASSETFCIGDGTFLSSSALLQTDINGNSANLQTYLALPNLWSVAVSILITPNAWNHLAYTISSTTYKLYLNGTQASTASGTFTWKSLDSFKYILGRCGDNGTRVLNGGGIKHFARFNSILSQADIQNIITGTT